MKNFSSVVLLVLVAVAGTYLITNAQRQPVQYTVQPIGQPVNGQVQDLNPVQPTPLPAPVIVTPVTVEVEVIREVQVVVTATPVPIVLPTLRVVTGSDPGGASGGGR